MRCFICDERESSATKGGWPSYFSGGQACLSRGIGLSQVHFIGFSIEFGIDFHFHFQVLISCHKNGFTDPFGKNNPPLKKSREI